MVAMVNVIRSQAIERKYVIPLRLSLEVGNDSLFASKACNQELEETIDHESFVAVTRCIPIYGTSKR